MKKNILIVDDEKSLRRSYKQMFTEEGFAVFEAADAVGARELLLSKKIDLVLLDLNMPAVSGEELFEVMRAFHGNVKVIIASVYPIDEQKRAAPDADDFFDKSDGPKVLIDKIRFHIRETADKRKIIIIDDNDEISALYKDILEDNGYESECFGDVKGAMQFIKNKNNRFDLVLLDISMPDLDPKHIFEVIREQHKEAKTLVASCHDVEYQSRVIPQADGYIDKSDGTEALLVKVDELADNKG